MSDRVQTHFYHMLLTNHCNQNCPFCYASKLMTSKENAKEMDIRDFTLLLKRLSKKPGVLQLKILGGEPTLHSKFDEMMEVLFTYVQHAGMFTNGIFNDKAALTIKKHVPGLQLTFNIMTPGFQYNQATRRDVLKRIKEFSSYTKVSLSIIVEPRSNIKQIISTLQDADISHIAGVRIGVSNPVMGGQNTYSFSDFPKIGEKVLEVITQFKKMNPKVQFQMDCGFTRCMFTDKQYAVLSREKVNHLLGCFQGDLIGCLDVRTDMKAFTCYSLSETHKINILKQGIETTEQKLFLQQYLLQEKYILEKCRTCKYGIEKKCLGPCIGFKMNEIAGRKPK